MKKSYLILTIQIIFYAINIKTSSSNKKIFYHELSETLFKEIDPRTISNQDENTYTKLIQLRTRLYDHYFVIQQGYSDSYYKKTKESYDTAITNAEQINSTENPKIAQAIQATLIFAKELIQD